MRRLRKKEFKTEGSAWLPMRILHGHVMQIVSCKSAPPTVRFSMAVLVHASFIHSQLCVDARPCVPPFFATLLFFGGGSNLSEFLLVRASLRGHFRAYFLSTLDMNLALIWGFDWKIVVEFIVAID